MKDLPAGNCPFYVHEERYICIMFVHALNTLLEGVCTWKIRFLRTVQTLIWRNVVSDDKGLVSDPVMLCQRKPEEYILSYCKFYMHSLYTKKLSKSIIL